MRDEVHRHGTGVNPGIGAPGRMDAHCCAEQFGKRPLDNFLNAAAVQLQLPAGKIGSVIFEIRTMVRICYPGSRPRSSMPTRPPGAGDRYVCVL